MIKKTFFLLIILSFFSLKKSTAQSKFDIVSKKDCITIPFKLVNNLILIPIELNGKELTFILDTGVSKSLLFNVVNLDSIPLNKTEKIKIKGVGEDKYFDAIKSKNNLFKINKIISPNFEIYMILDVVFDFSTRLGVDINGLIGTDLLKDFVVNINYIKKKITFTKHEDYKIKKIKKYKEFDLVFLKNKPYMRTSVSDEYGAKIPVNLLIDSGLGDSVWLFEDAKQNITIPKKNIDEYLGKGLSGNIFGKKAKMANFYFGEYNFKNIITAYPDNTSFFLLNNSFNRNGTVGSEILRRFHITFDYKNKKMFLKQNRNFKSFFFYDKSGLEIIRNGKMLVREEDVVPTVAPSYGGQGNGVAVYSKYNFIFKNSYSIAIVKPGSPADIAGLKVDDIILEVNGKPAYEFKLTKLIQIFSAEDGDKIKLRIDRNGFKYNFVFYLKDVL